MIVFTVSKYNQGGCLVQSGRSGDGMNRGLCVHFQSVHAAAVQASMGLDTMLFGVSGS